MMSKYSKKKKQIQDESDEKYNQIIIIMNLPIYL